MSDRHEPSFKDKAKRYLGIAIILALAIWGISAGISAGNVAEENQSAIQVPDFTASLVLGGPERFPESFEDALNVEQPEGMDTGTFLWSTLIVKNVGEASATTTEVTLNHTVAPSQVLVWTDGYGVEASVQPDDDGTAHVVQVENIGSAEELRVLLGYEPQDVEDGAIAAVGAEWYDAYEFQIESVAVEAENTLITERFYFPGFVPEEQESSS